MPTQKRKAPRKRSFFRAWGLLICGGRISFCRADSPQTLAFAESPVVMKFRVMSWFVADFGTSRAPSPTGCTLWGCWSRMTGEQCSPLRVCALFAKIQGSLVVNPRSLRLLIKIASAILKGAGAKRLRDCSLQRFKRF